MYLTTIASVMGATVYDNHGRMLQVAGNKPVAIGEQVWTDGRIIYGNSLIGGGSTITAPANQEGMLYYTMDSSYNTTFKILYRNGRIKEFEPMYVNSCRLVEGINNLFVEGYDSDSRQYFFYNADSDETYPIAEYPNDATVDNDGNIISIRVWGCGDIKYDNYSGSSSFWCYFYDFDSSSDSYIGTMQRSNKFSWNYNDSGNIDSESPYIVIRKNDKQVSKIDLTSYYNSAYADCVQYGSRFASNGYGQGINKTEGYIKKDGSYVGYFESSVSRWSKLTVDGTDITTLGRASSAGHYRVTNDNIDELYHYHSAFATGILQYTYGNGFILGDHTGDSDFRVFSPFGGNSKAIKYAYSGKDILFINSGGYNAPNNRWSTDAADRFVKKLISNNGMQFDDCIDRVMVNSTHGDAQDTGAPRTIDDLNVIESKDDNNNTLYHIEGYDSHKFCNIDTACFDNESGCLYIFGTQTAEDYNYPNYHAYLYKVDQDGELSIIDKSEKGSSGMAYRISFTANIDTLANNIIDYLLKE